MRRSKESLQVTQNEEERTFTIKSIIDGKLFATYETIEMTQEEFEEEENNTKNDWKNFLKTNQYHTKR